MGGAHHKIKRPKEKSPRRMTGASIISLTMSYFHTGIRTIIGAEAFHCPVRDGKEWDHLAMVIRLNRSPTCFFEQVSQFVESTDFSAHQLFDCAQLR
jgi:hypothetical protein